MTLVHLADEDLRLEVFGVFLGGDPKAVFEVTEQLLGVRFARPDTLLIYLTLKLLERDGLLVQPKMGVFRRNPNWRR